MKAIKRIFCVLLAVGMVVTLCACGGTSSVETSPTASVAPKGDASDQYEIVIVPKNTTNSWFQCIAKGGAKFGQDFGANVYMKGSDEADAAQQVEIIESLIAAKVDAICVIPHDISALESVLKSAMDAGIVVICHEASTQENCHYDIEAFDNNQFGRKLMDSLASWTGEEGEYCVMVGSLTNGSHNEWADGAVQQAQEKYPGMKLVGDRMEIHDDSEKAYELAVEMLNTYPNLKGFIGTAAQCVPGVARAIEEMGLEGKVFISGMALASQAEQYIDNGTITSVLAWDPFEVGYAMTQLAYKVLEGEEIKDGMALDAEGYEKILLVDDKVLYGSGWITIDGSNVTEFDF